MREIPVGIAVSVSAILWAHQAAAQTPPAPSADDSVRAVIEKFQAIRPDVLKAEIEGLRAEKVAWREIAWEPCLLAGLKESREQRKPVLLWIFIDRPADDARC